MKILNKIRGVIYYVVLFNFYILFSIVSFITSNGEDSKR